jgi:hypothetical protein
MESPPMAQRDRDEDKKRRRKKRLEKRRERKPQPLAQPPMPQDVEPAESGLGEFGRFLTGLRRHLSVPEPSRWPGGCDRSLDRPDRIKLELAQFATEEPPGKAKARQLEDALRKGLLGHLPDIDHWSWEEFIWHGLPGDPWHPVDAFLAAAGSRFPPAAAEQLRRWKEARIGLFEVGAVADDLVALREWDGLQRTATGPWFRAIGLNIGGVNWYRDARGQVMLTYVAPWQPSEGVFCAMGYGMKTDKGQTALALDYLGLRHPDVVCRPLPWKASRAAAEQHLRHWRQREWHGWLRERLRFPFLALVLSPPDGRPRLLPVHDLLPSTPEQARQLGIYLDVILEGGKEVLVAGGTNVVPLDVTSPNRLALAEYHAYRERVGPPPAARNAPRFFDLR